MTTPAYWHNAGAEARVAGVEHGGNPYLAACKRRSDSGENWADELAQAEAWWDGWEAEDARLSPPHVWRETVTL